MLYLLESLHERTLFKQWKEDNRTFVSTRACKEVEKLIKSQNLVVVTGNSGSGKTAIIQQIALSYMSQGWTVKPVYSVKDIIDATSRKIAVGEPQNRILFVFNDPFGNEYFDEIKYNLWKEHRERLKTDLKIFKMLLSCRKYILNDARVKGILKDKSCIIDLSEDEFKLDCEEKHKILDSYSSNSDFSKENIDEIIKTEDYFPLLCKLFFSDKKSKKWECNFLKNRLTYVRKK